LSGLAKIDEHRRVREAAGGRSFLPHAQGYAGSRRAPDLQLQIQTLREHFEQTGERAWDAQAVKVQ
jgi:hypothetical protein